MSWWLEKGNGVIGVGAIVKAELCEVVEVRRVSDSVIAVVLFFEEDVQRLVCGYAPQSGSLFAWRKNYVCQLHCLRERKGGR